MVFDDEVQQICCFFLYGSIKVLATKRLVDYRDTAAEGLIFFYAKQVARKSAAHLGYQSHTELVFECVCPSLSLGPINGFTIVLIEQFKDIYIALNDIEYLTRAEVLG